MSTGKTNLTSTQFAAKKLLGKAHLSNIRDPSDEAFTSNVSVVSEGVFAESIPNSPGSNFYTIYSASAGAPGTVEKVYFKVVEDTLTRYEADGETNGGAGDENSELGPHGFYLQLASDYETSSSNPLTGSGVFVNDSVVHSSRGGLQLIPSFVSTGNPNPYQLKLYNASNQEIEFSDNTDWTIDYYAGTIFIQDYTSSVSGISKVPVSASAYIYVGKYLDEKLTDLSSSIGSASGTITALNNQAENRLVTIGSTTTELDGEANLTFDGSTLQLTGALAVNGESSFENTASFTSNVNFADHVSLDVTKRLYFDGTLSDAGEGPFISSFNNGYLEVDGDNFLRFSADTAMYFRLGSSTIMQAWSTTGLTSSVNTRITQDLTVEGEVSSSTYYGDGSNLTGINAGISYSRTEVTTTITASVSSTILGVTASSAVEIRLPSAADYSAGQYFTVKDESGAADVNNITILASGSQKIDGVSSIVLESPYAAVNIYSNGTDKFFIY